MRPYPGTVSGLHGKPVFARHTGEITFMSDKLTLADPPAAAGPRHAAKPADTPRRGPAIVGALTGVAVVGVLVAIGMSSRSPHTDRPAAIAAAPAIVAAPPTAAVPAVPAVPRATGVLARKPVVGAGHGRLRGLVITPIVRGTGPAVRKGQTITVNYVLIAYASGRPIESSWDSGGPVPMVVGTGHLIEGWDRGLPGQRVGSRVRLDVPAALAYGPSRGDLRFVIDILAAK